MVSSTQAGEKEFQFRNQSFQGRDLTKEDFSNASIRGCDFSYADLTGVDFSGATIDSNPWELEIVIPFGISLLVSALITGTIYYTIAGVIPDFLAHTVVLVIVIIAAVLLKFANVIIAELVAFGIVIFGVLLFAVLTVLFLSKSSLLATAICGLFFLASVAMVFYLYQEAKDHIPAYFSEFEYNHGHKLGRSESEIQQSSWSKYIQGFFLSDFELLTFKESIIEYSDFLQAWLENHIAELAYEVNLQTVALGCQRYYIPNISPQVTFPQTSIQQGDSHKALVSVVYRLENLNPTYDFLVVNGDTLTLDQNGTAGFLIPSEERGRQDLEVSFYGLDPFAKRMEESTILYSYEVLEKE